MDRCHGKISEQRRLEREKKVKAEETIARKIDKIKNTTPHQLLEAKIDLSVATAPGQRAKGYDKQIDYGHAYSLRVTDNDNLFGRSIDFPPGLADPKAAQKPKFRNAVPWEAGKGTGKEKGTSKGKNKGKNGKGTTKGKEASKGKSKGLKGGKGGWSFGTKGSDIKGKKSKGKGKGAWKK